MIEKTKKILKALWILKDKHPFDFIAHFLLGLIVFVVNFELIEWILKGYLIDLYVISPEYIVHFVSLFCSVNFIVAVELTQFDVFGINNNDLWKQCSIIDYVLDLVFGGLGIVLGLALC